MGNMFVTADAQFGIAKILRPYEGFDAQDGSPGSYQGLSSGYPLMLTENGLPLDPDAGKPGYSPVLLRGLPVPYGSRITLWFPIIQPLGSPDNPAPFGYQYGISWRLRNTFDFRQRRVPYHYPKQAPGIPIGGDERVVIPAASNAIVFNPSEPLTDGTPAASRMRAENIISVHSFQAEKLPKLPDGSFGTFEQGVFPVEPFYPTSLVYETQALGDEMLLSIIRPDEQGTWDFSSTTATDYQVSALYGVGGQLAPPPVGPFGPLPDLGVYVIVGAAP